MSEDIGDDTLGNDHQRTSGYVDRLLASPSTFQQVRTAMHLGSSELSQPNVPGVCVWVKRQK
jgi:hypothetical protein